MRAFFLRWSIRVAYVLLLALLFGASGYYAFSNFVRRGSIAAPDVIGLDLAESAELLGERGLKARHLTDEDRFDDAVPAGRVVQQRPRAGTLMKRGGELRVILSRGKQLATVPDLTGQALQVALTELAAVGLQLGRRGSVFWNGGEPGTVVHQSP